MSYAMYMLHPVKSTSFHEFMNDIRDVSIGHEILVALVERPTPACDQFLKLLSAYQTRVRMDSNWPGTSRGGDPVEQRVFRHSREVIELLQEGPNCAWDWIGPHYPEDPSFLRADGTAWFITTSHERDVYFRLTRSEYTEVSELIGAESLIFQSSIDGPGDSY